MMSDITFITEGITESERFLHTPGEFARDHLIYIQEMGKLRSVQSHRCVREKLNSYLIFLVIKGSGVIQMNGEEHSLATGACVFVDCEQHYEHQSSEADPWELVWIHCNGPHIKAFHDLFKEKNKGKEYITIENIEKLKRYFDKILKFKNEQGMLTEFKVSILIEQMIAHLLEEAVQQEENNSYMLYKQIREYINKNYQKQTLTEKMSEKFNLSEREMDQGFQSVYGIELYDYILNRRFTKAKELLRFSIKPVGEVVELSGICNVDLFRKLFKEHEKMTAEEYREKWAQWVR